MPRPSYRRVRSLVASVVAASAVVAAASAVPSLPAGAAGPGLSDRSRLTVHEGGMTVTQNGAVIENLEIRGTLRIEASNVVVRNVWVYTGSFWTIYVASGSAQFENIEVGHANHPGERGIGGNNVTVRMADIHHVEDGIKIGSNSVYDGINVHDLDSPNSAPHSDAMQAEMGAKNTVVRNSTLNAINADGSLGNAAVIIKSDFGRPDNIRFENNYMNGGNFIFYSRDGGHGNPTNIVLVNNRFGRQSRYGMFSIDGSITTLGNVWADTGLPIDGGQGAVPTTTAPPVTTTAPPTTTAPRPTTTVPPVTTTAPRPTTTAPRPTTTAALVTTTAPQPTTTAPRPTTTAAPVTTTAPRPTTTAPRPTTTAASVATTRPITIAEPTTTTLEETIAPPANTTSPATTASTATETPATNSPGSNTAAPSSRSVTTTAVVDRPNASRSEIASVFDRAAPNSAFVTGSEQVPRGVVEFGATPITDTETATALAASENANNPATDAVKVGGIMVQATERTPIAAPLAAAVGTPTAELGVVVPGSLHRVARVMAKDPLISTALLSMAFFTMAVGLRSLVDRRRRQVWPQPRGGAVAAMLFPPKHLKSRPGPATRSWSAGVEPANRAKHLKQKR